MESKKKTGAKKTIKKEKGKKTKTMEAKKTISPAKAWFLDLAEDEDLEDEDSCDDVIQRQIGADAQDTDLEQMLENKF